MKHDAIVVTSWSRNAILEACAKAHELGLEVLGPSDIVTNRISTLLICPDGSKEGWGESDLYNDKRAKYLSYLNSVRYDDGSSCLSWVAFSYSSDDREAMITSHAWQDSH